MNHSLPALAFFFCLSSFFFFLSGDWPAWIKSTLKARIIHYNFFNFFLIVSGDWLARIKSTIKARTFTTISCITPWCGSFVRKTSTHVSHLHMSLKLSFIFQLPIDRFRVQPKAHGSDIFPYHQRYLGTLVGWLVGWFPSVGNCGRRNQYPFWRVSTAENAELLKVPPLKPGGGHSNSVACLTWWLLFPRLRGFLGEGWNIPSPPVFLLFFFLWSGDLVAHINSTL